MVKYFRTFYFSVNTELIEIIPFKPAYRVQLLHYYADKQTTKLTSDQCLHTEKKTPKTKQKIKDLLPQADLPDVPDMTLSFFPIHLFESLKNLNTSLVFLLF